MLIKELFPELTKQIRRDLRRLKRTDLAEQVDGLHVLDRCRCGSKACGTFYTQGLDLRRHMPMHSNMIMLECGATLTEVRGKIIEVETLDPHVSEVLLQVIP